MNKLLRLYANLGLTIGATFCSPVTAQSQSSLYGFKITSSVNTILWRADDTTKNTKVCLPAKTSLTVIGKVGEDYKVELTESTDVTKCAVPNLNGGEGKVISNVAYVVSKSDFENSGFTRRGATYGVLVIPFKYQLTGNKQFTSGASLGGYAGYRFETTNNIGITATPILFAGTSSISVKGDTADSTKSLMGFTYGIGLMGTLQNSFQSGLVIGWDRVGKSDGYQYNGKPWIAIQIGFPFLQ